MDEDPRLKVMKKEWFEGKDCLDIGCNSGIMTIHIGIFSLIVPRFSRASKNCSIFVDMAFCEDMLPPTRIWLKAFLLGWFLLLPYLCFFYSVLDRGCWLLQDSFSDLCFLLLQLKSSVAAPFLELILIQVRTIGFHNFFQGCPKFFCVIISSISYQVQIVRKTQNSRYNFYDDFLCILETFVCFSC